MSMVFVLNAAVVGVVMLLSASGKAEILALFGMSVGTSVAVIDYISRIFSPIESLGMEIQTFSLQWRVLNGSMPFFLSRSGRSRRREKVLHEETLCFPM